MNAPEIALAFLAVTGWVLYIWRDFVAFEDGHTILELTTRAETAEESSAFLGRRLATHEATPVYDAVVLDFLDESLSEINYPDGAS